MRILIFFAYAKIALTTLWKYVLEHKKMIFLKKKVRFSEKKDIFATTKRVLRL